jgi:hypothetical protein
MADGVLVQVSRLSRAPSIARFPLLVLAVSVSACALQPYGLISTATHPGGFSRPMQSVDVGGSATVLSRNAAGEACSHNLLGLYAWGNAGIAAGVKDALAKASTSAGDATMLADVKIDHRIFSILGVYSDFCTQVSGIALK